MSPEPKSHSRKITVVVAVLSLTAMTACADGAGDKEEAGGASQKLDVEWRQPQDDWDPPTTRARGGCEIEVLPGPEEYAEDPSSGEVTGMSASGEYIVGEAGRHDVVWHDGEFMSLDDLPDLNRLVDVTSSGIVLGARLTGDGDKPWILRDGELTELTVPKLHGDQVTEVVAINDDGYVLGNLAQDDGMEYEVLEPLMWHIGTPEEYSTAGLDGKSDGLALTEMSMVVGTSGDELWTWNVPGDWEPTMVGESTEADEGYSSGDWVLLGTDLLKPSSAELTESELDEAFAVDADGRQYGLRDNEPVFADGDEITTLPFFEPRPDSSSMSWAATEAGHDGETLSGTTAYGEESSLPVTWHC